MSDRAIFVAGTGQHVGKTTICLGLVSGLKKRLSKVGFIKPVGQSSVTISPDVKVDKDVILFENGNPSLQGYSNMSPVLFPPGFTRRYLEGEVSSEHLLGTIRTAFKAVDGAHDFTVAEGTGHSGVGSIIELSNARVAAELGLDVILICPGGLGAAFDCLAINKALFDAYGVRIRGVILNKVREEKRQMLLEYFPRALERWGIPLIGCIPYNRLLGSPSIQDLCFLFGVELLTGEEHCYRHFVNYRMVATSVEIYRRLDTPNQLIITSATREDIIDATLEKSCDFADRACDFEGGLILTGETPPSEALVERIRQAGVPMLYTPIKNFKAMKRLTSHTAKIRKEETAKVNKAIEVVERYINFEPVLSLL